MPSFFDIITDGAPLFITAIPHDRSSPTRWMSAKCASDAEQFLRKHDKPGVASYFAVARLREGAQARSTGTVAETLWLWADVDFKDHPNVTPEEIDQRVTQTRNPPTIVVNSGHGRHLYWRLHEPEDLSTEPARRRVVEALELACQHVSGDPSVCEPARLMRMPGSHNTKNGGCVLVGMLSYTEHEYDLDELVDWWLEARPILPGRRPALVGASTGNGHTAGANPFAAFADQHKAPIDVSARLAQMRFGGPGETSIHATQLACMASLLTSGTSLADATATVLGATRECVAGDARAADWNWRREETDITEMGATWIAKKPELAHLLPDDLRAQFEAALAAGGTPRFVRRFATGLQVLDAKQEPNGETAKIEAIPFKRFDPAALPPREWLYGGHYQRGVPTATVGPGAGGKSSLGLTELMAMCTGKALLGEQPRTRCRAWYHNAEDGIEEIYRRIAAICQHYEIDQAELEGWLFVTSGVEMPIRFATSRNGKVTLDAVTAVAIIRTVTANEIGVTSFDPLVAHHTVTENATGDMDQVCRELARIANVTDCAIEIVHHTRKPAPGQEELSVVDSRGAVAIINAVRSARVLNTMSRTEAEKVGIDDVDRRLHFRVDNGKANMAPPSAARWRKLIGIDLPNGDNVGVVTAWEYPTAAAAAAADLPDVVCTQIQAEVAKGIFKAGPQSPDWIGNVVARHLRLDRTTKPGRAAVDRYLQALYNKGVITTAEGVTSGHKVRVVVPGAWVPIQPKI